MTAFERVKKISDEQGIPISRLEDDLGFGKNSLYTWKKSSPSTDKLQKVADYLNVSVDYLLGRTDIKNPLEGLEDAQFLDVEGLTSEDIAKVEGIIKALKEAQRKIDEFKNMQK
ncbi:TPA: helix-turn-helix transcriptional regulator [Listeria monocytogenes]|uniref:helix-turn-helix domain-containing protein n=1 Tax=Listeria monocytogenes TaxID=1639 RepID=UPI000E75C296|nr:helix-turn-helix transcriptional regulator [Listeria monocytogenes]EAE6190761.1 XRE family transcriptional regulator [Listeria monocytogenes]EAK8992423.1 helix-turn-helix transcriptional regulator [Listeria monocytogenes]EAK8995612.1 helix-turn-helix transcriptional regulator [Listeria monocytogenes]EBF5351321.1 helix-turn-helix transcriptional regulator [Listeria monocytogenes]EBF6148467.1 helix-turn-helix transcriptional regulator [Listeria monocytogenes]